MAAHKWEIINQGQMGLMNYGKRKCTLCGAEQIKHSEQNWGYVTGYRWTPLVGRCPGKFIPKN